MNPVPRQILQGFTAELKLVPELQIMPHQDIAVPPQCICHIEFQITDENEVLAHNANNEITFEITGPDKIIGIGNGDISSIEDYKELKHNAYNGKGLAIVQSIPQQGTIEIIAKADGLQQASIKIEVEE